MIWGRAWRALSLLGLDDVLREVAGAPTDGSGGECAPLPNVTFAPRMRTCHQQTRGLVSSIDDLTKVAKAALFTTSSCHVSSTYYIHHVRFSLTRSLLDPGHLYHRAHFLLAIADRLPEGIAHLGRRIVSYSQRVADRTVEAKFEDGSTEIFDVFLGCDGIKSMVRQRLCEDYAKEGRPEMLKCVEPVWTGEVLYRNLIPSEKLPVRNGRPHPVLTKSIMVSVLLSPCDLQSKYSRNLSQYCGHNKVCLLTSCADLRTQSRRMQHFFGYAIGRGKWANVGAFVTMPERRRTHWDGPWVSEASTQEVLDNFVGWESDLLEVIQVGSCSHAHRNLVHTILM